MSRRSNSGRSKGIRNSEIRENRLQMPHVYKASNLYDDVYLRLDGGTVTGTAVFQQPVFIDLEDLTDGGGLAVKAATLGQAGVYMFQNGYLRATSLWNGVSNNFQINLFDASGSASQLLFSGSISGAASIFWNGSRRLVTDANGIRVINGADALISVGHDPEGSVTATLGSLHLRTDTGALYKKTSGSGNTGWSEITGGGGDGSLSSHQNLSSLQGGGGGEYYHLTSAQWAGVTAAGWASATHTHDYSALYAALSHTHSYTGIYAVATHTHSEYLTLAGGTITGSLALSQVGNNKHAEFLADASVSFAATVAFGTSGNRRWDIGRRSTNEGFGIRSYDASGLNQESVILATRDGSVELYFDDAKKLETTSGGVLVTGILNATTDFYRNGTSLGSIYASATHVHSTGSITSGIFDPARLGSGTATSTTYLRGDGVWATVSGSGDGSMSSHQALSSLQGGTTNEYYHLTSAQWAGVVAAGWASATHNHAASAITSGTIDTARLGSGTADGTTYLRGDQTWATPAGSSEYVLRADTATATAGAFITWQRLNADQIASQSNSATVMFSTKSVGSGTWNFEYWTIYQTAATTTGIGMRVNHTGASPGHFVAHSRFVSTGGAAATGVADQVQSSQTAGIVEGKGERVLDTQSSFTVGVDTASANMLVVYEGILVVVNSGDLQLKVTSEVNGSNVHVKAGSFLKLSKIA